MQFHAYMCIGVNASKVGLDLYACMRVCERACVCMCYAMFGGVTFVASGAVETVYVRGDVVMCSGSEVYIHVDGRLLYCYGA